MRRGLGLLVAVLALTGCKSTADPKSPDREPFGRSAARTRPKDGKDAKDAKDAKDPKETRGPTWLDPVAKLPGSGTEVPTVGTWSGDPKSPNFDAKLEAQDAVGGKVIDVFNRPARNIFIRVEAVNDPPGTAAKGIYTDNQGYFFTRGLKPGTTYNLTAEATLDGKLLTGSVQTRVPNPVLTIVLREDLGLPPIGTPRPGTPRPGTPRPGTAEPQSGGFPPPPVPTDSNTSPATAPAPGGPAYPRRPNDGAYTPDAVPTRPAPPPRIDTSPTPPDPRSRPTAPGGVLPPPDDLATPTGKPIRPENVADGPKPVWQPPTTNIPGPPAPVYPVPPPSPPSPPSPSQPLPPLSPSPSEAPSSSRTRPGAHFTLLDSHQRPWHFPADRSGSLVLLEFVTTSCTHCKPVIPVLKDLQARYATAGLQVIAVLCDELPPSQRAAAAGKYGSDYQLNYSVFIEPGATPGALRDRLGVEAYPTAVLLDANGAILWRDHPGKKRELEAAVEKGLKK